jgi:hypothetical protein
MGNRGILHNPQQTVVRDWQVRRWIACRLEFRGRHREVMQPGSYTELFFLDEATALADGHRPCAECRHMDYRAFQAAWHSVYPRASVGADAIDKILHVERRTAPFHKRTYVADINTLPDYTYVVLNERAWLIRGDSVVAWAGDRYVDRVRRPSTGAVTVLTPLSVVQVLRAGYQPDVHPSGTLV